MWDVPLTMACAAVVLGLGGPAGTPFYKDAATLGMDGAWTVPSWERLEAAPRWPAGKPGRVQFDCIVDELLRQRETLRLTDSADTACPPDWPTRGMAVIAADPVMQRCTPSVPAACRPGDTCS